MRLPALVLAAGLAGGPGGVAAASLPSLVPVVPPGDVIRVKGIAGDTVLSLVPTPAGWMVRADVMARLLGGTLDSTGVGQWRLGLFGATLALSDGAPFALFNGFPLPLLEATRVIDGAPHVALQLFSEIVPRFEIGILWDRTRWEVRLLQGIARRAVPVAPGGAAGGTSTPAIHVANDTPEPLDRRSASPPEPAGTGGRSGLSRRYTVVVDAGHGGVDPGNPGTVVHGRRVRESTLTLAIALKLEKELRARGVDVYMTRRTDTLIARDDRGRIANRQRGDLFISIHTNAANPKWRNGAAARGFETYFLSTARTEDERRVAAMENDVVRFESTAPPKAGDPLAFIIADLAQNEHLRESSELAAMVQEGLGGAHPGPNRGVKQAGFAVLAQAYMPAVLVEIGFGTNREDATWLASAPGQQTAAAAIADATMRYLLGFDRRTRATQR